MTFCITAQSLKRPHIWVNEDDREQILANIAEHEWAASQFDQLVDRNSKIRASHAQSPKTFLSALSTIPGDRTSHREDLNTAAECAVLYYLTKDKSYAQIAADVIHHYLKRISTQDPLTIKFFNPERSDSHHIQIRELYTRIGITYDLTFPFISQAQSTVYDLSSDSRVKFDFQMAQKALEVLAENVLLVGGKDSNHPLLELAGGLYVTLCMDDDAKRNSYYDRFWRDEPGQNSIAWMLNNFPEEGNIWPEAMGYSKGVHDIMLRVLNVIDRYEPHRNIISDNLRLLDGAFVFENFKYPNDRIIAFGDSHRHESENEHIIRYVHAIAHRKGLAAYEQEAARVLKAHYDKSGYQPKITTERLNWDTPLELLWGVDVPDTLEAKDITYYPTIYLDFANIVMQRNYVTNENEQYGLMYYSGGGTYVHAHATGIDLEIYGAGYVIGPMFGRATYGSEMHEQYAVSPAGHNTVIVNGKGGRGPKTNGNSTWQNIVGDVVLEACEPKSYASSISQDFSFSSQYLDDSFNGALQLRTNGIIRTSPTSGYYLDVFRSKSKTDDRFHDYLFHGLGDDLGLFSEEEPLALAETPLRYQNDQGDERKQPGWRWFSEARTSVAVSEGVTARFDLKRRGNYLHVTVPAGVSREYTTALAPPSRYVRDYADQETQVFIMRKYGEAWNEPFVTVFEPSDSAESTLQSTSLIRQGEQVVGVEVVSMVDGYTITDIVISNGREAQTTLVEQGIRFSGRFAIARTAIKNGKTRVALYIGHGSELEFDGKTIKADEEGKAFQQYTLDYEYEPTPLLLNNPADVCVYPIPSSDGLFFLSESLSFKVFSLSGELVAAGSGSRIDLTHLPSGVYVSVSANRFIKLVKQ